MLSKTITKRITSLQLKKFRQQEQLFIAEGVKVVRELLDAGFYAEYLFATTTANALFPEAVLVHETDMKRISVLVDPAPILGVFRIPQQKEIPKSDIIVVSDGIRDPGNLGALIRLCDWFGIPSLLCSPDTVDIYNPKVVQASMGSLARVQVAYKALPEEFSNTKALIYGTFMDGESIYETPLQIPCYLVFGNEANGIRKETHDFIQKKISIPRYGDLKQTESLNVTTAAAIILAEIRRNFNGM
jgi:TrmH family RNA methyltransferase